MKLSLLHKVRPCWDALGQIWGHDVPSKEQREEYYIVCPPWGPDSIVHARRCSWAHVKPSKLDQVVACHMRNEPNDVHGNARYAMPLVKLLCKTRELTFCLTVVMGLPQLNQLE